MLFWGPSRTYQLPGGSRGKVEQGSKDDPEWKDVPPRGRRNNRPAGTPKPPKPPSPRRPNPKAQAPNRKRWASWSSSGSDPSSDDEIPKQLRLTLKKEDVGLIISSEPPRSEREGGFRSVCSMAELSKPRRKLITKGISQLRDHDKALKRLLDVSNIGTTVGPKHLVMFTSEPKHFQDPMVHCVDVGIGATGNWTPNGARKELQGIGPSLVVVATRYKNPNDGLNHSYLLDEVISHCDLSGTPYLVVDGAQTYRWKEASVPIQPMYGKGDISFYSNEKGFTSCVPINRRIR